MKCKLPKVKPSESDKLNRAYSVYRWLSGLAESNNEAFLPLFFDEHRFLVLKGGAGSGKSVFASRKVLERASSESGHRFLVCRKVARTLRESCFRLMCAQIAEFYSHLNVKINKGDMKITFPSGSEILFAGLDDVEKLKSIYEITDIWIEEASEILEADFNQLNIRMRGKSAHYRQMIITFNPVSIMHWLKRRFFDIFEDDRPEARAMCERIRTHESTYRHNRWLCAEDIAELEAFRLVDEYYYQVYCLGMWGITGKTVFDAKVLSERLAHLPKPLCFGGFEISYAAEQIAEYKFREVREGDPSGALKVFKRPEVGVPYVIGVDTAGDGSDYFVAQVLDNRTGEQVAVLRRRADEDIFAHQLYCLGLWYNTALMGVEVNFSSYIPKELQRLHYPSQYVRETFDTFEGKYTKAFGFRTDTKTRPVLVSTLVKVVRENSECICDSVTIGEMLTFVRDDTFKPVAEDGAHDDCVMALGIAHLMRPHQDSIGDVSSAPRVKWHESQWEDYNSASPDMQAVLLERWGTPIGM